MPPLKIALKSVNSLKNIGFDYSSDRTIQPSVQLPQIVRLDKLSTIANIGINSGGKNYLEPPRIIVIDRCLFQGGFHWFSTLITCTSKTIL